MILPREYRVTWQGTHSALLRTMQAAIIIADAIAAREQCDPREIIIEMREPGGKWELC